MKSKFKTITLILVVNLLMINLNGIVDNNILLNNQEDNNTLTTNEINYKISAINTVYTLSSPIAITDDASLANVSSGGSGNIGDPYVIKNLNITSNSAILISIENTTKYFSIVDNILNGIDGSYNGIFINNSNNGIIDSNTISNTSQGIYSILTIGTAIKNNIITTYIGNSAGIYLKETNQSTIFNNTISGKATTGIYFDNTNSSWGFNHHIYNNTIIGLIDGLNLNSVTYSVFNNNTLKDLTNYAVSIRITSDFNIFENNTLINNYAHFVFRFTSSDNNRIGFNSISGGSFGLKSISGTLVNNYFYNNCLKNVYYGIDWGVLSTNSVNNSFAGNEFSYNMVSIRIRGDNGGINLTNNFINNSYLYGIAISGNAQGTWIQNNTISNSVDYGLNVSAGASIVGSKIMFNDFINNGGIYSQVYDQDGLFITENFYLDQYKFDINSNGYSDSSYAFDGGILSDYKPLSKPANPIQSHAYISTPLLSGPPNPTIELNSSLNSITWEITDSFNGTFFISKDDVPFTTGTYKNGTDSITFQDVNSSILGINLYKISILDMWGNYNSQSVTVTTSDTVTPVFTSVPNNLTYDAHQLGQSVSWVVSDLQNGTYKIFNNGLQVGSINSWTIGVPIVYVTDDLKVGTHNITITVYDDSGNSISHNVFVTSIDTNNPIFTSVPADSTYDTAKQGRKVSWIVSDLQNGTYKIFLDGVQVGSFYNWTNDDPIVYNIDGLKLGSHNITIVVYDASGNSKSDEVFITFVQAKTTATTTGPQEKRTSSKSIPPPSTSQSSGNITTTPSFDLLLIIATLSALSLISLKRRKY